LRRAKLEGYQGGKSALYELVHSIRPKPVRLVTRFEGLPGEFTQHDFGEVDVRFLNGTTKRVHFFGSRLKYSRRTEVSLVPNEQVEALVRTMVEHFDVMGGIPLLAVFDRPKTIAISWGRDGQVTKWNPTFAGVTLDLGLGIELCWPHSPEQKGSVENLVKWVKGSFFKQRRFLDEEDLQQQLREWLVEVNTQRPSRATGVIPEERMKQERPRLRPLKVTPAELALRIPITVGPTGVVLHDTHCYSMDPESLGIPGTLYLYRDLVRIVAGRFEAVHTRLFGPPSKSTLPEHRAQRVAAAAGKRGKRYMQREHLLEIGGVALEYLTELTHRRPQVWTRDVEWLHSLLDKHGDEALRAALERGLAEHAIGAEYIAHYLSTPAPAKTGDMSTQQELPL
jgi:transposase